MSWLNSIWPSNKSQEFAEAKQVGGWEKKKLDQANEVDAKRQKKMGLLSSLGSLI